ncbi:erythrocyte membrane protein 1, PfEMP1, putative [Plasmodium reichenowi]|uniref:Erythrocyte membrane protein 1, PfEMP1, putative n=1 Tax=Plasmodium reichenowi TaxID=5854 RepID=A0A2P9D4E4_PLARE|nr:erythrocyte membrane protein 1, PfEMP1, putative [Plasmodium reichenowi]
MVVTQVRPGGNVEDETAKNIFDRIGEEVYKKVHGEALTRGGSELHGLLSNVQFKGEETSVRDPCELDYNYETSVTTGHSHPCESRQPVRFSDEKGAECYWNRIKGSDRKTGSCAPLRRLHLCDKNLEQIQPQQITNTHNLLVDVLLAAKHEGESLVEKHKEYKKENPDFDTGICTVLARSFADIGDIIRGKDLFLGHQQKKKYLEDNFKKIFKNMYDNLTEGAKTHYSDTDNNYYKLREDWWDANRKDVWKAVTCGAGEGDKYFGLPCSEGTTATNKKCRCATNDVPTYFDYVPQYLRWFHEWAEDFCRKRKHKLQNAKKFCREGKDGEKKYCSGNGYDCMETVRKINKYNWNRECTGCFFSCSHFRKWIKSQKEEFKKQKGKYGNEIKGSNGTTKDITNGKINNLYVKDFYEKLEKKYGSVDKFLELLNKETTCQNHPIVKKKTDVDFKDSPDETFSQTEYCEPCPWCGIQEQEDGTWERKEESHPDCPKEAPYTPPPYAKSTEIDVLYSGEGNEDILVKLSEFCKTQHKSNVKNEKWKCYYGDVTNDKCVLEYSKQLKIDKKVKDYSDFMMSWVTYMLKDSIDWRKYITRCINNGNGNTCISKCHSNCKCFKKWIEKKKTEWGEIKQHFGKETHFDVFDPYKILEFILEDEFFNGIKQAYGNDEAIDRIDKLKKDHANNPDEDPSKAKYAIDVLLDHELEEAEDCLEIHEYEEAEERDDECDDDHEEEVYVNNRCSGGTHRAMVNKVAAYKHLAAKIQLLSRGSKSNLKGKAHEGIYNEGGNPRDLKKVCDIKPEHSNRDLSQSQQPCQGKGDGFTIGTPWKTRGEAKITDEYLFLPPRREHYCTSNLERLKTDNPGLKGDKAIHSLLGDVLLSAKYQAEQLINKYKENVGKVNLDDENDKKTVCRAMKYSFADIGDIIRGKDLWDKNEWEKNTQSNLEKIFKEIKQNLPKKMQGKYDGDDQKTKPPYKQLREDWWTANRHQVWRAMTCATKKEKHIKCGTTPYDDYIPQRLRWMTEWAEWYCKAQSQEYWKLFTQCRTCKSKSDGQSCYNSDPYCQECKKACDKYTKEIEKWRKQWNKMNQKYTTSYLQAQTIAGNRGGTSFGEVDRDYQQVVHFFEQLQEAIKSSGPARVKREVTGKRNTTDVYSNAAGYIHQEAHIGDCEEQREFCNKENGVTAFSDRKENENYAFKNTPKDHDKACACQSRPPQAPKPKKVEEKKDACTIVADIIKSDNDGTKAVGQCNPKENGNQRYPGWNCSTNQIEPGNAGACMPPRRQKLCLYYLTQLNNGAKEENLREAFIKTAAAETFFAWYYYRKKNGNGVETQLKEGNIPPVFLRSMYYTFADYRDIFFGTDICAKTASRDTSTAKDNIKSVFSNDSKSPSGKDPRETWWEKNAESIWKGMVCGLSHAGGDKEILTKKYAYPPNEKFSGKSPTISVETFSQTPQFLRWMTEWGDDFCKQRKEKVDKLVQECNSCTVSDSGVSGAEGTKTCKKDSEECIKCREECKKYQEWLETWQEHYDKQSNKYFEDKKKNIFESTSSIAEVNSSSHAYDYLKKVLPKSCPNESCNCMEETSQHHNVVSGTSETYNSHMPASLDYPPKEINGKCSCTPPLEPARPPPPPPPPGGVEKTVAETTVDNKLNVCSIVDGILTDPSNFSDTCTLKYGAPNRYFGWKCVSSGNGSSNDKGSICIPPRKRRLYVGKLTQWAEKTQSKSLGEGGGGEAKGSDSSDSANTVVRGGDSSGQEGGDKTTLSSPASSTSSSDATQLLRDAFIQSAAVETFFLWHRYKEQKKKEKKEKEDAQGQIYALPGADDENKNKDPEKSLQDGDIPEEFKRQMFYTLADYRDVCVGVKDEAVKEALEKSVDNNRSGDQKCSESNMQKIENKIKEILEKPNGDKAPHIPVPQSGDSTKNPSDKREEFWNQHGKVIWKGMICALSYDTTSDGKSLQRNENVYSKFFGDKNSENGTYNEKYKYESVKLDQEQSGSGGAKATGYAPPLTEFVKIPFFFRWLEEWGDEFCRKKKHKLDIIEKDCRGNDKVCSGDGLECTKPVPKNEHIFKYFGCHSCGKHCSSYRRWIERKKIEFTEQSNAYNEQKENCKKESTGAQGNKDDNGFCGTLEKDAGEFLNKLKNGPCKKDDDTESGKDDINFNKDSETFQHTNLCDPCSKFKIDCQKGNCSNVPGNKCDGKTDITAEDIKKINDSNNVFMTVNDSNTTEFGDLSVCAGAGIFKGIRKDEWKCGEYCGVDICTLKKTKNKGENDEHIIMKELVKRWLETFFEDYNRIQKKLNTCTENGKGSKCIKECVEKWVEKKQEEWKNIKKDYIDKYNIEVGSNDLNSFLETLISEIPVVTDKRKVRQLSALENSLKCKCAESSKKENDKTDLIDCMLDKLQQKANKCKENPSTGVETKASGENQPTCGDTPPHVGDDDDPLEEEDQTLEEAKKMIPQICGDMPKTQQEEEEGDCTPATVTPAEPKRDSEKDEGAKEPEETAEDTTEDTEQNTTDNAPAKEEPPAASQEPETQLPKKEEKKEKKVVPPQVDKNPFEHPYVKPALVTSTLAWSVGIAFAALTYWFIKKKSKPPVVLFSVLEIPKSDYDIATLKSSNRYIPYASGKYRGKRYIYIEGDSATDSGYTDHYSDITSSSESEYEELDINDIYPYQSPKYKTLIEVVLEPSKRDTQNDIPSDNTPNNKLTDNEWNELKNDFITNLLQSEQNDIPNDYTSGNVPLNTQPKNLRDNVDEKPFIMSIHDRNLLIGEEISYDMTTNSGENNLYSGIDPTSDNRGPTSGKHDSYSGIDLINDSLSGDYDIYDEILKRKENELFGTKHHPKHTTNRFAKPACDDPILNQLNLFHKWLDRHRNMCEKLKNDNDRLAKLKEKWENETNSGDINSGNTPPNSDIPSGKLSGTPSDNNIHSGNIHPSDTPSDNNTHSDIPYVLNSDVSIQIDMDNPKLTNEFSNMDTTPNKYTMDTIMDDLEKYNEPYYDVQDDIYYDVNDDKTSVNHINMDYNKMDNNNSDVPTKVQIEMNSNNREVVEQQYPIADMWNI